VTQGLTRWWWLRHAPVPDPEGRITGRLDLPCDTSDTAWFAALARRLPRNAVLVESGLMRCDQTIGAIEVAGLALPPPLARLRGAILQWGTALESLDSTALMNHLQSAGLAVEAAQVLAAVPSACAAPGASPEQAEAGWWHFFGLMDRGRLQQEVETAQRRFAGRFDAVNQRRLIALRTAFEALCKGEEGADAP